MAFLVGLFRINGFLAGILDVVVTSGVSSAATWFNLSSFWADSSVAGAAPIRKNVNRTERTITCVYLVIFYTHWIFFLSNL